MARACARHILVKTRAEAEKLKQRLAEGEDFGKLAKNTRPVVPKRAGETSGSFRREKW